MQSINVSMIPKLSQPVLYYSQGDVGREFSIKLKDFDIPSGAIVTLQATKPSGFGFTVSGTVSGNIVSFTSTAAMTDEYGRFPAELHIESGGIEIGSANFMMEGERSPHPDGTTDGQSESAIPQLTLLVERIETAASSIHELSVSATTLNYDADATATYDGETNELTIGVPRGGAMSVTDPNSDGNIVISFA